MSGASNLGYGNTFPLSDINSKYANPTNSHFSGNFTQKAGEKKRSTQNIGILKHRVNSIAKRYKRMRAGSRQISRMKRKISRKFICSKCRRKHANMRRRRTQRKRQSHLLRSHLLRGGDGYSQFTNNQPNSTNVQMAGIHLPASQLGLANPAPYTATSNSVDNYNHYNNTAFASRGH